jgi:hypothetical protein
MILIAIPRIGISHLAFAVLTLEARSEASDVTTPW